MDKSELNIFRSVSRKASKMSVCNNAEEEKLIEEITTTSYEKVIRILTNLKLQLEEICFEKDMINDLQWVIKKIQTHTLYTYELSDNSLTSGDHDVTSLMEYLNDYSEVKDIQRRNKDAKLSKSTKTKPEEISKIRSHFSKRSQTITFKKLEEIKEFIFKEEIKKEEEDYDLKIIDDIEFDIFNFEKLVGNKNVFPFIAKFCYNTTSTINLLNQDVLDKFLERSRDGYNEVPYHNSLHGADVCQTILIIMTHTNCIERFLLSPYDILSMVTAALLHDIGHNSTNNTFQINSGSDHAITYNDKSVLENYHAAEGFRIMVKPDSNILSKLEFNTFRHVRKRIIEQILATDMIGHAKIITLIKNKLSSNNLTSEKNFPNLLNETNNLFDEQQEILNFLIHTCDIGHGAKPFALSLQWTNNIMEEFWNQGDLEKRKGLPVSFLCDRDKADVPKNQIVFIKSILSPNYEILIEIFPGLSHFKVNLEDNINNWVKIMEEKEKQIN